MFPGDWEALKGKTVKIYTVQVAIQDANETDARAKLNFAAALMKKFAAEGSPTATPVDGAVVIFDAADGGLAGATLSNIQQLAKGAVSEEAFWKQCYLDPPETFQTRH
jgi:translation elongation factor EF-4